MTVIPHRLNRLGYEKLAQRGIQLLTAAIQDEFETTVPMGAELEFGYVNKDKCKSGDLSHYGWLNIPDYRPYKEIVKEPGQISVPEVSGEYLNRQVYISHFYRDVGGTEAVFSHRGAKTNPLRLSGAIENFKKRLLSDRDLTGEANVSLSPYIDSNDRELGRLARYTRGLEFNFSFSNSEHNRLINEEKSKFFLGLGQVICEVVYFGFNDVNAANRLFRKYGELINSNPNLPSAIFITPKSNHIECDYLSPNSNAYLGALGLLCGIYQGLLLQTGRIEDPEIPNLRIPDPVSTAPDARKKDTISYFQNRLENAQRFRNILNKLSKGEKLGDNLLESVLSAERLVTPIGNEVVQVGR